MMVAGLRVSCATCDIDSSPTNEMMASEVPKANSPRLGGLETNWWKRRSGFQTSTNPATTMIDWATIVTTPRTSFTSEEIRMPM